jgi:glycerate dehydrogenase
LRFIGLTATGTDNINLDAARSFGVAVCNIRAYCTQSVVEHVIGVMLMLAHNLGLYDKTVHAGAWQASDSVCLLAHPIPGLADKTLGIVGYGALGHGVAKVASAFGMQVLVSARPGAETIETGRVAFDELLDRADFISLHCPLTDATHGLFGADEFQRMKSTAFVINTARGALIDAEALVEALQSGAIAGAAVDVLAKEPPPDDDPIINYPGDNLIITPHVAWAADAARQNAIDELAANVEAFLNGEERNRVV